MIDIQFDFFQLIHIKEDGGEIFFNISFEYLFILDFKLFRINK